MLTGGGKNEKENYLSMPKSPPEVFFTPNKREGLSIMGGYGAKGNPDPVAEIINRERKRNGPNGLKSRMVRDVGSEQPAIVHGIYWLGSHLFLH